jgi:hypothetical protein
MNTMKRTLMAVVAGFAVGSTSALAQGVKMTDEQLDQITAAGAIVILATPGRGSVERDNVCVNCATLAPTPTREGRVGGAVITPNGTLKCIGAGVTVNAFGLSLPLC